jgi:hypothetical protein
VKYILEKIQERDREKIMQDSLSNERISRFLKMRGGHLENNPEIHWAIDRENDSYLFLAPRPAMTREHHYCLFFGGKMYVICIESPVNTKVSFDEKSPAPDPLGIEMKAAIKAALATHGLFGMPVNNRSIDAII